MSDSRWLLADAPFLRGSVHLASDLGGFSARPPWFVTFSDGAVGPVRADVEDLSAAQRAYWRDAHRRWSRRADRTFAARLSRETEDLGDLEAAIERVAPGAPLVIWAARSWCDTLFVFRALDAIARAGISPARVRIARFPATSRLPEAHAWIWLGTARTGDPRRDGPSLTRVARALARAAPLGARTLRAGAAMWRRYADADPRAFARTCAADDGPFPALRTLARRHLDLFPALGARGVLRLSRVDRAILGWLDDEPRSAAKLIGRHFVDPITAGRGDLTLGVRLHHFSDTPFVERSEDADGALRSHYRLTERGARLVARGIDDLDAIPVEHAGGATLYRGARPWVRRGREIVRA